MERRRVVDIALNVGLAAVLIGVFAYSAWVQRFVGDDAYIGFRYARNLAEGLGLVWNPGERVEGYTHFFWVVILAAGIRAGIAPEALSQGLGVASGLAVLALTLRLAVRLKGRPGWECWIAPTCLALNPEFGAWATGGLSTMFFAFLGLCGLSALHEERERDAPLRYRSSLWFALATLTRPEGGLFALAAGLGLLVDVLRRRLRLSSLVVWTLPFALIVGSHTLWRHSYYGYWLPNTFYAKVGGLWWEQGLHYLGLIQQHYLLAWLLPLLLLGLVRRPRFTPMVMAVLLLLFTAYILYIGGDRFAFRFLVHVAPCLYLLLGYAATAVIERPFAFAGRRATLALAGSIALAAVFSSALPALDPERRKFGGGVISTRQIEAFASRRVEEGRILRELVELGRLPEDVIICAGGAGALPYYSRLVTVDYRGLSDVRVAHQPLRARGTIGHERTAGPDYQRERGVLIFDVISQIYVRGDRRRLRQKMEFARVNVDRLNRDAKEKGSVGSWRVKCLKMGYGMYLVFATPLPEDEYRSRVGHLDDCSDDLGGSRTGFTGVE